MIQTPPVQEWLQRIDRLVQEIEQSANPAVESAAREMVRVVLDLHTAGLTRIIQLLAEAGPAGRTWLEAATGDELVAGLLLLHNLHPDDLETRVARALEGVRPVLQGHGGGVELLEVSPGTVRLRMQGSCHGCPSSSVTLRQTIEQAIYDAAPEIVTIDVEGVVAEAAPTGLVQIGLLPQSAGTSTAQG